MKTSDVNTYSVVGPAPWCQASRFRMSVILIGCLFDVCLLEILGRTRSYLEKCNSHQTGAVTLSLHRPGGLERCPKIKPVIIAKPSYFRYLEAPPAKYAQFKLHRSCYQSSLYCAHEGGLRSRKNKLYSSQHEHGHS